MKEEKVFISFSYSYNLRHFMCFLKHLVLLKFESAKILLNNDYLLFVFFIYSISVKR